MMFSDEASNEEFNLVLAQRDEAKTLLRYVYYQRLPTGEKIEEYIPFEWQKRVVKLLDNRDT